MAALTLGGLRLRRPPGRRRPERGAGRPGAAAGRRRARRGRGWDERYGWRTAVSRRHPIGKDTGAPPEGEGIRYLSEHQQREPSELLAALTDHRHGTRHPKTVHPAGGPLQG
ncbi:hypothetical protein [Streptomyces sp. NPDC007205]|uniref:hypothetical protein n=1 Tax=Streptomyces sp. NPDC007205 TaxID=3154316 RepID=UPI0033D8B4DF